MKCAKTKLSSMMVAVQRNTNQFQRIFLTDAAIVQKCIKKKSFLAIVVPQNPTTVYVDGVK